MVVMNILAARRDHYLGLIMKHEYDITSLSTTFGTVSHWWAFEIAANIAVTIITPRLSKYQTFIAIYQFFAYLKPAQNTYSI